MTEYKKVLCHKCGYPEFEYDSSWKEYSCKKCGWIVEDAEKILAIKKTKEERADVQLSKVIEKKRTPTGTVLRQPKEETPLIKKKGADVSGTVSTSTQTKKSPRTGTVIRAVSPDEAKEKPKTLLEIADAGDWEIKQVKTYDMGDVIDGQYKVEKVFTGGMGHIYITKSENQGIRFAIKQPNKMMLANKSFFGRVLREADAWTGLGMHPHIAYCYFVKKIDGIPYIFVEYVDGDNLREWIADGSCADFKIGIEMSIQFCHGMQHAHNKGMMHRDIKPENVLITKDGMIKVTDFGLAGEVEKGEGQFGKAMGGGDLTRIGDVMGTEAYMSPEQWKNPHEVGPESDVFSFGVCMWEIFCGKRPYQVSFGDAGPPPDTRELRPDIPDSLSKILYKSTDLDKDKRQKDFTELRDELNNLYKELFSEDASSYRIDITDSLAAEWCNRGYSYYQLGDRKRAEECWEKALKTDPHHPEATYNQGLVLWRTGRITDDELVRQLEAVAATDETAWRPRYLLGLVHFERGDRETAQVVLREAEQLVPEEEGLQESLSCLKHILPMSRTSTFEGHRSLVTAIQITSDNRWLVSGSLNNTVRVWDIQSGDCLYTLSGHKGRVNSLAITPDGRQVISASDDHTLRLWDLEDGVCIRVFEGHQEGVKVIEISPDGRLIVSASLDHTLRVWNLQSGDCLYTLSGHKGRVNSLAITPDGRQVISASDDHTLRLWDLETGECAIMLIGHEDEVWNIVMSSDGRFILSGSADCTLRLWDRESGKCMRIYKGHEDEVANVVLSPDGGFFVSGSSLGCLMYWNLQSETCLRHFKAHEYSTFSLLITPDGQWAVSASEDNLLRVWDLSSGCCIRTFEEALAPAVISGDGEFVITGAPDDSLRKWCLKGIGENPGDFVICKPRGVDYLGQVTTSIRKKRDLAEKLINEGRFADAGSVLCSAFSMPGYERNPPLLDLWYTAGINGGRPVGLRIAHSLRTFKGHNNTVLAVAITPDGQYAVSGCYDGALKVWELEGGSCLKTLRGHTRCVRSVAISPDSRYAVSGSMDKTLKVWELKTGQCVRTMEGHGYTVNSIAVTSDGRYAISGSDDKTVRVWELETGRCVRTMEGHTDKVSCVSISPDVRYAVSGSMDKTIRMWELATGRCIKTFVGHAGVVSAVTFTSNGRYVVSGSWDKKLRLWDLNTGGCKQTFEGHKDDVKSLVATLNERYIVSGSLDNTLRLWELETGHCVRTLTGHKNIVNSVAISQDSRFILSGSKDKVLKLWQLDWDYTFPEPTSWDDMARPFLDIFLTLHCPYGKDGISRVGRPSWNHDDFNQLVKELQHRGYGWLRPEGVRQELEKMTKQWKGPPNLYEYERGNHINEFVDEQLKVSDGKLFFTTGEWYTLLFAPLRVANLVAGIDEKIDKKANEAVNNELSFISKRNASKIMEFIVKFNEKVQRKEQRFPNSEVKFAQTMMEEGFSLLDALFSPAALLGRKKITRVQQIQGRFKNDSRGAIDGLAEVANILDNKTTTEQAREYKEFLQKVVQKVAEAVGGGFFGLRGKISKKQKKALKQVSDMLMGKKKDTEKYVKKKK